MTTMTIRDVSLYVEVMGHGDPLLLMHGGPGLDHVSLTPFRACADRYTVVFYDHRCNGRSTGAPVTSMTFENLTADADALRESSASSAGRCSGTRSAATSPSSTHSAIRSACRSSSCSTRRATRDGRRRTRRTSLPAAGSARRRWPSLAASTTADRPEGLRSRGDAAHAGIRPSVQPASARPRDVEGGWRMRMRPRR